MQVGGERSGQVREDVVPRLRQVVHIEENFHVARARRGRLDRLHGYHRFQGTGVFEHYITFLFFDVHFFVSRLHVKPRGFKLHGTFSCIALVWACGRGCVRTLRDSPRRRRSLSSWSSTGFASTKAVCTRAESRSRIPPWRARPASIAAWSRRPSTQSRRIPSSGIFSSDCYRPATCGMWRRS